MDILIADIYNDTLKQKLIFSNIDLSNYYTESETNDIDNGLPTLILNIYTKTEVDTQLTDYATISYLQGNYMTTLSITETLMNNYASITFITDIFQNLKLIQH